MIELEHVTKTYRTRKGPHTVLDDISVHLPAGRNVGILGVNGAGKSTLLRLLSGVEKPDSGVIRNNVRLSWPLGFRGGFQGKLSGRENAKFVARIYGAEVQPFIEFVEQFSELGKFFDQPIYTYSSGMRARFAFAVSLAADFDCYLVDEATAVGDQRFKDRYRQAFEERKQRADILMVSHNPETIRRDCDMGAVLHQGKITLYDDVEEAIDAYMEINRSAKQAARLRQTKGESQDLKADS